MNFKKHKLVRSFVCTNLHNRFILMELEMTEINFVMMHKETTFQLKCSKTSVKTAISILRLSRLVMKPKIKPEEEDPPQIDDQPSASTVKVLPPVHPVPKGVKRVAKEKKKVPKPVTKTPEATPTPIIIREGMVTVGTQTTTLVIPVKVSEEEDIERFDLMSTRQQYMVNNISPEEFPDPAGKGKGRGKRTVKKGILS